MNDDSFCQTFPLCKLHFSQEFLGLFFRSNPQSFWETLGSCRLACFIGTLLAWIFWVLGPLYPSPKGWFLPIDPLVMIPLTIPCGSSSRPVNHWITSVHWLPRLKSPVFRRFWNYSSILWPNFGYPVLFLKRSTPRFQRLYFFWNYLTFIRKRLQLHRPGHLEISCFNCNHPTSSIYHKPNQLTQW